VVCKLQLANMMDEGEHVYLACMIHLSFTSLLSHDGCLNLNIDTTKRAVRETVQDRIATLAGYTMIDQTEEGCGTQVSHTDHAYVFPYFLPRHQANQHLFCKHVGPETCDLAIQN
jgi:hypothetical protein